MIRYTIDACAAITLINEEQGVDLMRDLIRRAFAKEAALNMHIINLTEVYYGYLRDLGREQADKILARFLAYPLKIIETIPHPVFVKASHLKAAYPISLADAYACATAWWKNSTLVTSDHAELEILEERESLKCYWLPAKPKRPTAS